MSERNMLPPAWITSARISSVPVDLYLFTFSIAISTSNAFDHIIVIILTTVTFIIKNKSVFKYATLCILQQDKDKQRDVNTHFRTKANHNTPRYELDVLSF